MAHVGANRSTAGAMTSSNAARETSPVAPAGTGRLPRLGDGAGAGVETPAPGGAEALEDIEMVGRMDPAQLLGRRRAGLSPHQGVSRACRLEPGQDGVEAGGTLGMPRSRVVGLV